MDNGHWAVNPNIENGLKSIKIHVPVHVHASFSALFEMSGHSFAHAFRLRAQNCQYVIQKPSLNMDAYI